MSEQQVSTKLTAIVSNRKGSLSLVIKDRLRALLPDKKRGMVNFNLDYELQMSVQFNALGAYPHTSVFNLLMA